MAEDRQGLTKLETLGYSVFAIPLTGTSAAITTLVPPYYAEVLGLSLAAVGVVFFSLRVFDAVTDPVMGWLLDWHPFRRQHKPWIAMSLPIFIVALTFLFYPVEAWVGVPYLLGSGFLAYLGYTIGLVTHQAWGASLAREPAALSKLMGQRELAVIFGILGVFLAPAIAEGLGYEGLESKVTAASGFLFICFAVFTPLTLWFAPDDPSDLRPPPIDLATARSFVTSRRFLLVSIANLSTSFAMVAMSVLSYFIAAYVFESSDRYGMAMTGYFIAAALGMSLWMRLSKRIGDRRTLMVAAAYITVALMLTPVLISFDGAWRYPFYTALLGVGFGAPPYLIRSLIGTLANAHEEATGEGVRGTAYAVTTFFDKLGSGFAAGIVLPLVGWIGFDPVGGGGEAGRMALLLVGTITPILGFGVAVVAAIRARDAARA